MLHGQALDSLPLMSPACAPQPPTLADMEPWMVMPRQPMLPYLPAPPEMHSHPEALPPDLTPPGINHLMHVGGASQQQKFDHAHSPPKNPLMTSMTQGEAQHKFSNISDNNNQPEVVTSSLSQGACVQASSFEEYSPNQISPEVKVC